MRFINVRELHGETPKVLRMVQGGERVVVTKRGKPAALLVALNEDEIEDLVLAHPEFMRELRAAEKEAKKKGVMSLAEARRRLGL